MATSSYPFSGHAVLEAAAEAAVAELSVPVEVEGPDGVSYPSFAAIAEAGYPVRCQQWATCTNAATVALKHPVLTAVPTCDRCARKVAELS